MTAKSVFKIGSVSKQMIAATVMLLANEGKLSLDDRMSKYFDGSPDAWNDITIRHLLTHTSGLVREGPIYNALKNQSETDVVKSAYASPLLFKPGAKSQYSNLGYFGLADIVARVSGKPWPAVAEEKIFKPLAMGASGVTNNTSIVPSRANGYVYRNGQYENAQYILGVRPSGAFMSNLEDMLKWDAALSNSTLLSQDSLKVMWTPATLNDGSTFPYGFGFQLDDLGSHRAISHGGSLAGFRSWYLRMPDDKLSVIVLTNNEAAPTDSLAASIAAIYIKELFSRRAMANLKAEELDALAGTYKAQAGPSIILARTAQGLNLQDPFGSTYALLPYAPNKFFSPDDPRMTVEFGSGAETSLSLLMNGRVQMQGMRQ